MLGLADPTLTAASQHLGSFAASLIQMVVGTDQVLKGVVTITPFCPLWLPHTTLHLPSHATVRSL